MFFLLGNNGSIHAQLVHKVTASECAFPKMQESLIKEAEYFRPQQAQYYGSDFPPAGSSGVNEK